MAGYTSAFIFAILLIGGTIVFSLADDTFAFIFTIFQANSTFTIFLTEFFYIILVFSNNFGNNKYNNYKKTPGFSNKSLEGTIASGLANLSYNSNYFIN